MIVRVDHGKQMPIEGIARDASVAVRGDTATVAVATADLITSPQPRQVIDLDGPFEVIRTVERTRQVLTFTCRRLADGR